MGTGPVSSNPFPILAGYTSSTIRRGPSLGASMKVLIIEDDAKLARLIESVLREERFTVDVALDGESGPGDGPGRRL